jgi:DNA polymerase III subunit gamma/tau
MQEPRQEQQSLYRRHRPRTFAEVVGQEPVVRTLRNAVERGKVHHAYLFVGSRGTGKTSTAKILAASLNCEQGPTIEPCGVCESCTSIARANSMDVIEMDAASNNSVEDIRELREGVAYAPVSGRRKVYILDEAHMLSTAAWNAFLKTLEEPPPNTVFVLATTEAQKVPPTVVDRCHRFDFHRPTVEQIASVVRRTAQAESIEIPPAAVAALARSATGSFRDALGTLEQLVTYSGKEIVLEDVLAVLGVADAGLLEETVDAVGAGDARRALKALSSYVEQGRDAGAFASDLEVRARELLVVQSLDEVPEELSLTPEADTALRAQAERVDHATVVRLLELLGEAMEGVRAGADPRTRLELALLKAAKPEVDGSTRALLARIERLERDRESVSAVAVKPVPPAGRGAGPVGEEPSPGSIQGAGEASAERPPARPAPDLGASVGRAIAAEARAAEMTSEVPTPTPPAPAPPTPGPDPAPPTPRPPSGPPTPGPPTPGPPSPGPPGLVIERDLESIVELWPAVVELVGAGHALCGAVITDARPVGVSGEDLIVGFPTTAAFLKRQAEDPANRAIVTDALRQLTGGRWRLSYELREELDDSNVSGSEVQGWTEEEWVARFKSEFDAEEIPVEPETAPATSAQKGE